MRANALKIFRFRYRAPEPLTPGVPPPKGFPKIGTWEGITAARDFRAAVVKVHRIARRNHALRVVSIEDLGEVES